jgi:hypothetical protein
VNTSIFTSVDSGILQNRARDIERHYDRVHKYSNVKIATIHATKYIYLLIQPPLLSDGHHTEGSYIVIWKCLI